MYKFNYWILSCLITLSISAYTSSVSAFAPEGSKENQKAIKHSYFVGMAGVTSPFLEYHPILPIEKDDLAKTNYYQVTTGKDGQLLEMRYFERGMPSNQSYFGTHKVSYISNSPNEYERRYFDKENNPASMWRHYYQGGEIHIERYKINEQKSQVTLFNIKNEPVESEIGSHLFIAKHLSKRKFVQTQYKLDKSPNKFRNAMPFMATLINLDERGFLDKVSNIDLPSIIPVENKDVGYASLKVHFDEYGFETGWDYLDANGNLTNDKSESLDIARWSYYRKWTDRKLGKFNYMWVQVYDYTGTSTQHPNGAATIRYQKDDLGRFVEAAYLNEKGQLFQPSEVGFAKREFTYNDDGTRVEIRFDSKGNVIN